MSVTVCEDDSCNYTTVCDALADVEANGRVLVSEGNYTEVSSCTVTVPNVTLTLAGSVNVITKVPWLTIEGPIAFTIDGGVLNVTSGSFIELVNGSTVHQLSDVRILLDAGVERGIEVLDGFWNQSGALTIETVPTGKFAYGVSLHHKGRWWQNGTFQALMFRSPSYAVYSFGVWVSNGPIRLSATKASPVIVLTGSTWTLNSPLASTRGTVALQAGSVWNQNSNVEIHGVRDNTGVLLTAIKNKWNQRGAVLMSVLAGGTGIRGGSGSSWWQYGPVSFHLLNGSTGIACDGPTFVWRSSGKVSFVSADPEVVTITETCGRREGSSNQSMSTDIIIGAAAAVGVAVVALVAGATGYVWHKRRRERRKDAHRALLHDHTDT